MATLQGICRNCGSLIMVDDRDSECECIFCNCVFPTSEAIEIFEDPDGREFPNEHFERTEDGKHHYTNRVYSTESLEKAVKRQELTDSQDSGSTKVVNEFEVSPNDVKAPPKVVAIILAAAAVLVLGVLIVALPRYQERTKLHSEISADIASVFDGIAEVDISSNEEGFTKGYIISGQTCDDIKIITADELDEDAARSIYDNYCALRSSHYNGKNNEVTMTIYTSGNIYTVTNDGIEAAKD